MSNKTIEDLREMLFFALEGLKSGTVDLDRAKAMSEVGQTIINSAKVEVEAMKVANASNSNFLLPDLIPAPPRHSSIPTGSGMKHIEHGEGFTRTTHRMG